MIPNLDEDYEEELEEDEEDDSAVAAEEDGYPSHTYALHEESGRIYGFVDDTDAIEQAIWKRLRTAQWKYPIYEDYGSRLLELMGKPIPYAMAEVKLRIEESLLEDDRIAAVDDFVITRAGRGALRVAFTVTTVEGDKLEEETEVGIA
ncbi:MAG: DUF2634 domain-containing protein [Butyricicoccus sp.]